MNRDNAQIYFQMVPSAPHPVSEAGTSITVHVAAMRHGIMTSRPAATDPFNAGFANHTSVLFQVS